MDRCSSQTSTISFNHDICRICHCEGDSEVPLITPCYCSGSLRYVHQCCLQQWIKSSDIKSCELCKFEFVMQTKFKPFRKWEKLEMTAIEHRKIVCSVVFHLLAVVCVIWSLYVLIERTADEIRVGILEWPFWTKLIVVAIGLTGGLVFMYIQCKMYVQLCRRWRAFNRVIYVQNAPEKGQQINPNNPDGNANNPSPFPAVHWRSMVDKSTETDHSIHSKNRDSSDNNFHKMVVISKMHPAVTSPDSSSVDTVLTPQVNNI